jgi:predicted phosphodiesterase
MMNILLIGDLHFKYSREVNVEELNQLHKKLVSVAAELKNQNRLDKIILLGDILDSHQKIHISQLTRASKLLSDLHDIVPIVVLIGNHDRINPKDFLSEESPFHLMKKWNNTIIADETQFEEINGFKFIYVPYVEPGRFIEAVETKVKDWKEYDLIFGHQEFRGSVDNHGFESSEGDHWSTDYPQVYTGHIHKFSKLSNGVTNVGTPYQTRFGEDFKKHILLLNLKKESNILNIQEEYIDTNILKKIIQYFNPEDIDKIKLKDYDNKNIYRLVFRCNSNLEIKKIKLKNEIKKLNSKKNIQLKFEVKEEVKSFNDLNEIKLENESFFVELEKIIIDEREKYWLKELLE